MIAQVYDDPALEAFCQLWKESPERRVPRLLRRELFRSIKEYYPQINKTTEISLEPRSEYYVPFGIRESQDVRREPSGNRTVDIHSVDIRVYYHPENDTLYCYNPQFSTRTLLLEKETNHANP